MPTPASGIITMQQINANLQQGNDLGAYRGKTFWTPQGAQRTISQNPKFSEFYNLQLNAPPPVVPVLNQTPIYDIAVNSGDIETYRYRPVDGVCREIFTNQPPPGLTVHRLVNPAQYVSLQVTWSVLSGNPFGIFLAMGQATNVSTDEHELELQSNNGPFTIRVFFTGNPK